MLEFKFFSKFLFWAWAAYYLIIGKKYERSTSYCYVMGAIFALAGSAASISLQSLDSFIYDIGMIETLIVIPLVIFSIIKIAKLLNQRDKLRRERNNNVSN